jgi:hypothetical protein
MTNRQNPNPPLVGQSPTNLTPRPGVDSEGLSTFTRPELAARPGDKVQIIDTGQLKITEAVPDVSPPGHVTIRPADGGSVSVWAGTRGTETVSPYTQDIKDAIVGTTRVPG